MVILCPKCSTGFNLPEKHITPKGAKLRCSRCSHVFRVRSGAGEEPEIFYKPEDEAANAAAEAPLGSEPAFAAPGRLADDADDHVRALGGGATRMGRAGQGAGFGAGALSEVSSPNHKTQFGGPGLAEVSSPNQRTLFGAAGKAAAREEEPGTMDLAPHLAAPELHAKTQFGPGSIAATREKSSPKLPAPPLGKVGGALDVVQAQAEAAAQAEQQRRNARPELDLFGGEEEEADPFGGPDPFAGAFELSSSAAIQKRRPRSMLFDEPEADPRDDDSILRPATPGAAARAAAPVEESFVQQTAHADPAPSAPRRPAALPEDVPEPAPQERRASASMEFWDGGGQGVFKAEDLVDPSFGQEGPAFDPTRGVIEPTSTPAPHAAPPVRVQAGPPRQAAPRLELDLDGVAQPAQARAPSAQAAPAAHHQIGGAGPQKIANLALIVLVVLFLFFGLVAALNDMMIDFKQFGHMLEVAFGGETYKPRAEWLRGGEAGASAAPAGAGEAAAGEAAAAEVLQVRGVWAALVPWTKKREALVVRGQLYNDDLQDYVDVTLRAQVLDAQGAVVAQAEAPLGAWITDAQIKELGPAKAPKTLVPEESARLGTRTSAPFTIVFDEVPKQVEGGEQVSYRVEIARRVGEKELTK